MSNFYKLRLLFNIVPVFTDINLILCR